MLCTYRRWGRSIMVEADKRATHPDVYCLNLEQDMTCWFDDQTETEMTNLSQKIQGQPQTKGDCCILPHCLPPLCLTGSSMACTPRLNSTLASVECMWTPRPCQSMLNICCGFNNSARPACDSHGRSFRNSVRFFVHTCSEELAADVSMVSLEGLGIAGAYSVKECKWSTSTMVESSSQSGL